MNADISCWSTRWHGVEEYPHRYATLRAHNLIKSKAFTDADLHMIAERTGDVMCYLFFRQAQDGSRSGITLCVNGYACRNLDRLALLAAPVVDALSDFVLGEGNDARTETFIAERLGELREKLEVATDLGESELSPIDYAIKDDNYISYAWGYADPKAILSSSEQGLTYVRFPGIATPTLLSTAPKVKSSRSSFFGEGRVVFLVIVLLISSLLVTVYFNNRYQKEKDLRISAQDELSALQDTCEQKDHQIGAKNAYIARLHSMLAGRQKLGISSAFEITNVRIASRTSSGTFQPSSGSPIDASDPMFLCTGMTIKSKTDYFGKYTFRLKFKHRNWEDSFSTVLYETSVDLDLMGFKGGGSRYYILGEHGTPLGGTWPEGLYNLEIWSDGQCLYIHSFGLY